jgi:NAD(P)-dependent dehydrogenase (short-subunit alcohol dehydrogenase family)
MRTISNLFDLSGRAALVTGGAGHLGRAIADGLAECGARVALLDRTDPTAAASALPDVAEGDHAALTVDLAAEDQVKAAPKAVVDAMGRLDIIIHCAAFVGTDARSGWTTPVEQQSLSTWREALEVNLTAPFALTQAAIPHLRASGHGTVVHIGSIYGVLGPDWSLYDAADVPGTPAAYAASKGGLLQMTRWLATTLAPDIRVNSLVPGGVERNTAPRFKDAYEARTPLGRMATEEDMKGAALFLATDASAYVTGQCLMIDGGWSAW